MHYERQMSCIKAVGRGISGRHRYPGQV